MKKLTFGILLLIPSLLYAQRDIDGRRIKNATLDTASFKSNVMNWIKRDGSRSVKVIDFGMIVDDSTAATTNRTAFWNALAYADSENYQNVELPAGNIWIDSLVVKYDSLNIYGTGNSNLIYKQASATSTIRMLNLSHRKNVTVQFINFNARASLYSYTVTPICIIQNTGDTETYSRDVKILNCNFYDCSALISGQGTADTSSVGFTLEGCTFRPHTELVNPVYNLTTSGIPNCFNGKFNYNYFYGGNSYLLDHAFLGRYESCEFIGNYIEKTSDSGIYLRGNYNTIAFNKVWYSGKDGIKVLEAAGDTAKAIGNLITGNMVWGAGANYVKDSATMIKAEGNHTICSNNFAFAVDTTGIGAGHWSTLDQRGIQVRGDSVLVTGNYCFGGDSKNYPSYAGIRIDSDSKNATITGNYIYNWRYGIVGTYGNYLTISNNTIKNSSSKGLILNSYDAGNVSNYLVIMNNVFSGGADDDILLKYVDSVYVSGNVTFGRDAGSFLDISETTNIRYGINQDFSSTTPPNLSSFSIPSGDSIAISGADFRIEQDTAYYIGIGKNALLTQNNASKYVYLIGDAAGQSNSGIGVNGIGYQIFQNNSGSYVNGLGYRIGQYNTGDYIMGLGRQVLMYNTGDYVVAIGDQTGRWNKGSYVFCAGSPNAILSNTGSYIVGLGRAVLRYNEGDYNTSIGDNAFNSFNENASGVKTFDYTDIVSVSGSDTITITTHGFGAADAQINLKYTQGTGAITGLTDGSVYTWKVVNANTIVGGFTQNITNAGTGTGHTMTPQTAYTNSTALGYNAEPDASNQVKLGDANVTSIKSAGAFTSTSTGTNTFPKLAATDSLQVGSDKWIRKVFQSTSGDSLGFIYYNTVRSRIDTVYIVQ